MRIPNRWGAFTGIEGLPQIIVFSNVLVFLFDLVQPGLAESLSLSHGALRAGQWWRLLTFVFVPPFIDTFFIWRLAPPSNVIVMAFWFMFLYTMATSLESAWGGFRFTLYFLVGVVATAAVALWPWPAPVTNGYLQASLFLAFATLFPDVRVMLFFLVPVRVRWLGWLTGAGLALGFLFGDGFTRVSLSAGVVNYCLILGPDLWDRIRFRYQVHRNRTRFRSGR